MLKSRSIIVLLLLIALLFRFINLSSVPRGFHVDELVAGYVGQRIFSTGADIYGNKLPLYFNTFGDYRPAGIFYLTGFTQWLFGQGELGVRFGPAVIGVFGVLGLYLFTREITKSYKTGIVAAFLLAILPWHIVLSRATSEGVVGLTFVLFGMYFLQKAIRTQEKYMFFMVVFLFLLSMFFYHPFRVIVPLLFLPHFLGEKSKKVRKYLAICFLFFFLITCIIATRPWGIGRFSQVSLFNVANIKETEAHFLSDETQAPRPMMLLFHNPVVLIGRSLVRQVLSHTSPEFLFTNGGLPDRYVVPEQGILYIFFIPLLIAGILGSVGKKGGLAYFGYLLVIGLLPAILTYEDSPNIHRSLFMMVPFVIVASIGVNVLYEKVRTLSRWQTRAVLLLCVVIAFSEVSYFWHQYTVHAVKYKIASRGEGNSQLALYLWQKREKYDTIYVTGNDQMPLYYLFFSRMNDRLLQLEPESSPILTKVDSVSFVKEWCSTIFASQKRIPSSSKNIYIDSGNCPSPTQFNYIDRITRSDGTVAFLVYKDK